MANEWDTGHRIDGSGPSDCSESPNGGHYYVWGDDGKKQTYRCMYCKQDAPKFVP